VTGWFCLVGLTVALGGCEGVQAPGGSGGAGAGGKGSATSGGANGVGGKGNAIGGRAGGGGSSGGRSSGGGSGTGGSAGEGGAGGEGGSAPGGRCELPFEVGPCDAAIPVYFHNPQTERCEPAVYGGCGGNENRFESLSACESACAVLPSGASCEVNGLTYPDGSGGVPDPFSCNKCACVDGQVNACTEAHCPVDCAKGSAPGEACASCGPTDGCLSVRTGCLPTCDEKNPCESGFCLDGLCKNVCG
jgi:hypothetical protein